MSDVFHNGYHQLIVFFQLPLIGVRKPVAEGIQGECKSKTFVRKNRGLKRVFFFKKVMESQMIIEIIRISQ